jgi:signal peptidase II
LKKIIKQYGLLFIVVTIILVLDQVTKALVRAYIPFGGQWMPVEWLAPYFRFVYWHNTGAAFGLFQNGGLVFGIMAVIVSGFIIYYFPQVPKENKWMRIALSMQMAGALGNLIDRLRFGPVTDFISVGSFAVFNIADSSITVGVGILILAMWLEDRKEKQKSTGESQDSDESGTIDNQA